MCRKRVFVVSDIHYACATEQARAGHELLAVRNPVLRLLLRLYRDHVWLHDPYHKNHLLDRFLAEAANADFVVAIGDYSCNTGFVGVGDDAACQSTNECLGKLRHVFRHNFKPTVGDHELGKFSLIGQHGGMRLASWHRCIGELSLEPLWRAEVGNYLFMGVVSSLIAFPVFEPESLPEERDDWLRLRETHLNEIRQAFGTIRDDQRLVLFCHDPTALPFLWREEVVRAKLPQLEHTIIGHLHSPLVFWKSQLLAGMPRIGFAGNAIRRFSTALREARHWREFHVKLCPALAGIELLKDGGYLVLELDPEAKAASTILRRHMPR